MSASLPLWFPLALSGALGAVLGSFLNVCIHRIPRDLSVVFPPSACPRCRERIAAYDNIPVVSWLLLRGRCRRCRGAISPRYPLVEALTAALFVLVTWRIGLGWDLLPALFFTASMVLITFVDLDAYIIPDAVTLPGIPLGILASLVTPVTWVDSLIGAVVGFLFLFGVGWGYRRVTGVDGMGGGDVKLAAMLGAFLGWQGLVLNVFLAAGLGSVVGLTLMAVRRGGRRTALPFGTFLAPAGLVVYLWGADLLRWWLASFNP